MRVSLFTLLLAASALIIEMPPKLRTGDALAAGKKRNTSLPPPAALVRAVELEPLASRYLEPPDPDAPPRVFDDASLGVAIRERLARAGGVAIVIGDGARGGAPSAAAAAREAGSSPNPCLPLFNTPPVPSARITMSLEELTFRTGSRGERLFAGFERGTENAYNGGTDLGHRNEFPFRRAPEKPGWFGATFDDTGGLRSGLELGHEINFEVLLLGANLKHTRYHATMGLDLALEKYNGERFGPPERLRLDVRGDGFYYDFSAHFNYEGNDFSGGFMIARKAALQKAFDRLVEKAAETIEASVAKLPLMSKVAARCGGRLYVSAGQKNYRVAVGQRFYDLTQWRAGLVPAVLTVDEVFNGGSRVVVSGPAPSIDDEVVSLAPGENPPPPQNRFMAAASTTTVIESVDAGSANVALPDELKRYEQNAISRLWNGLKELVTLPYRIWRYFQYDQAYKGGELWQMPRERALELAKNSWALRAIGWPEALAACTGDTCLGSRAVIVALVDSGVDYNHRELRRNIFWDGVGNTPGWDFISGDARPYDDHAHGTEVASLITGGGAKLVGVAPNVTLLPAKVFSPYGVTSSAALYSAFVYALAQGAKIIVAPWATTKASTVLNAALALAEEKGALVVAAAGDGAQDLARAPAYPASAAPAHTQLLVVTAAAPDGRRAPTANFGPVVALAAPGAQIPAAQPRDRYATRSHTGLASGITAGAAALLWSRCPASTALEVKSALLEGARIDPRLDGEVHENRALFLPGALSKIAPVCK